MSRPLTFGLVAAALIAPVGARPSPRWRLGVDAGWVGWKHAFQGMPIRLSNGSNANVNIVMNGSPTNGTFAATWPTEWQDAWTARIGAEFAAAPALTLRGGAIYGSNPVSSECLFTVFPAIVQSAATLGLGYQVGATTASVTYAHAFARAQTASATSGVGAEYANSTSRLGENTLSVGLGWHF